MRSVFLLPLLVPALAAVAQESAPSPQANIDRAGALFIEGRFRALDLNQDGKLSPEEAKSVEFFIKGSDADGDGFYTLDEVQAQPPPERTPRKRGRPRREESSG